MTFEQAEARHAELVNEIRQHDYAYYVLGQPTISDYDYDKLFQELIDLEAACPNLVTPDSPSQRVGGNPAGEFERVKHEVPMLSLEKIRAATHPNEDEEPQPERRSRSQDENSLQGLRDFDHTIRKNLGRDLVEYVMEPKVDGVSIGVHYRKGKLALGVTRGDGQFGDNITANIRTIRGIPLELRLKNPPELLEVRGEAYISRCDFKELRETMEEAGEEPFDNPRNATAGTLKQLDPKIVAQRPLRAVFYGLGSCEGISFSTHSDFLESLKQFGLPTQGSWWLCKGIDEVLTCYNENVVCHYNEAHDLRSKLPYEIDGIVLKTNRVADWKRIPPKSRAPGYAIVHKPIPWITPAETLLKAITIQVGRTGVLTPVAELEPVLLQGSTISRATLHNEDEVRRKDIRVGDTVEIRKAGMVIPEVRRVIKSKRPPEAVEFDLWKQVEGKCPACGGPIAKDRVSTGGKQAVAWRCQNIASCPAQRTRRLDYFAQRRALDIESLGGVIAEKLVANGLVTEPLDLFKLTVNDLSRLNLGTSKEPRFLGEKNATKIVGAVKRAKHLPLHRWLYALAIAEVGEATAYQIALTHRSLDELPKSWILNSICELARKKEEKAKINPASHKNPPKTVEEKSEREQRRAHLKKEIDEIANRLAPFKRKMPEVGPVAATSILKFFLNPVGKATLSTLKKLDINPQSEHASTGLEAEEKSNRVAGKTFVLTGTLATLSREEASAKIRSLGGRVTSSVSSNTDFLVVGEEPGSKADRAQQLGVKVLSEEQLLDLLQPSNHTAAEKPVRSQQELL